MCPSAAAAMTLRSMPRCGAWDTSRHVGSCVARASGNECARVAAQVLVENSEYARLGFDGATVEVGTCHMAEPVWAQLVVPVGVRVYHLCLVLLTAARPMP